MSTATLATPTAKAVTASLATPGTAPNPVCPKCQCKYTVKKGKRRNRMQTLQVYECSECLYRFTAGDAGKNKTYPLKIILEAVSTFNLGYSLTETQHKLHRRFHREIPERTISSWLAEQEDWTRDGSAKLLDESLRLLRTDHVDLYQFHALSKMSDLEQIFGPNGAMETFEAAKKAGKLHFGGGPLGAHKSSRFRRIIGL